MVKFNSLEHIKRQYPHFLDKEDDSNFTQHLKVICNQYQDLRHKLKTVGWSRILEKPLQVWKEQEEPYKYNMCFKCSVDFLKDVKFYKNPILSDSVVIGYEKLLVDKQFNEDNVKYYEKTFKDINTEEYKYKESVSNVQWILTEGNLEDNIYHSSQNQKIIFSLSEEVGYEDELSFDFNILSNDYSLFSLLINIGEEAEANIPIVNRENRISLSFNKNSCDYTVDGELIGTLENIQLNETFNITIEIANNPLLQLDVGNTELVKTLTNKYIIPYDNYLLEVTTWDDYRFLKGYPENDYTVTEDNILNYKYNISFLDISIEEVSYTKYLVFRVHKDRIKKISILKNNEPYFTQEFNTELIAEGKPTNYSYYYYSSGENGSVLTNQYEVEDKQKNYVKTYFTKETVDEYVYRIKLTDDDFQDGVLKDIYDLLVTTYETRYHDRNDYEKSFNKRYNGYDGELNDCFDHDYSLDVIGNLLNVPRYRLYQVYRENTDYLSRTYPKYYNRATEDDYHYMKRMQYYISHYNVLPFPVLEFWKYYQVFPTLKSRKKIIGVMDETMLHTDDLICDKTFLIDELTNEDDSEEGSQIAYSVNKATSTTGKSTPIVRGDKEWEEAIIVRNVYVVPKVNYRLRYGVKEDNIDVNIRMICYNYKGNVLRTSPIIPETHNNTNELYNVTEDYEYTDTIITIPSDTSNIELILESNNSFEYTDVSFERMTVVSDTNKYMTTSENYNSNFYELYTDYEQIPTNIHMGDGERFKILLQRSLPLTKKGLLYMNINEPYTDRSNINTSWGINVYNLLTQNQRQGTISDGNPYNEKIQSKYVKPNEEYGLIIQFHSNNNAETITYSQNELDSANVTLPEFSDSVLLSVEVEYYNSDNVCVDSVGLSDKVYSDTLTKKHYEFTSIDDEFSYIRLIIQSETEIDIDEIRLYNKRQLTNEELVEL